ncbi:MAG: hypothetical protein B9J98_01635 [Candidatus Terraquivivens tikiterensis]|uniref:Molybdate/tungstate import ATP-binding protein WtpC n=1 Tax=Candidatus Terraquivivens tikiterensis TaxID=1980982 RepID=A0A2R7Y9X6_9ARCH|nr:MAG: hypothetical protein B9J98_01635 [Candidatus Terraquivivens tikiterensis]
MGSMLRRFPPEKRRVGYVPADYALFPNMTVRKNIWIAFSKSKEMGLSELQKIVSLLQIDGLMERKVESLSSGQKQRTAIARALAAKPDVLLLDEPCAALDPPTRETFRKGISRILRDVFDEFNIPVLYTTHDLLEASVVGDKIAIMNDGRIEQIGFTAEVFENPCSKFVAEFLGYNVFNGKVVSKNAGYVSVDVGGVVLNVEKDKDLPENVEDVVVIVRPRDVVLSPTGEVAKPKWKGCLCNVLKGTVGCVYTEGSTVKADIVVGDVNLKAEIPSDYLEEFDVKPGDTVFANIRASRVKVLVKDVGFRV